MHWTSQVRSQAQSAPPSPPPAPPTGARLESCLWILLETRPRYWLARGVAYALSPITSLVLASDARNEMGKKNEQTTTTATTTRVDIIPTTYPTSKRNAA